MQVQQLTMLSSIGCVAGGCTSRLGSNRNHNRTGWSSCDTTLPCCVSSRRTVRSCGPPQASAFALMLTATLVVPGDGVATSVAVGAKRSTLSGGQAGESGAMLSGGIVGCIAAPSGSGCGA